MGRKTLMTRQPTQSRAGKTVEKALPRATSLLGQSMHVAHEKRRDRQRQGKAMRQQVPLASPAEYEAARDRPDPVALLQGQDAVRDSSLVPIRFGRMVASPFAFYRGAAIVMAGDLARTPTTGWLAQSCGDAHLDNFGAFGTEQGSLVFDVNDFDETYPAPWEWDLKRLVTSAVLAAREIDAGASGSRRAAAAGAAGYRNAMQFLAAMDAMSRWRSAVPVPEVMTLAGASKQRIDEVEAAALRRTSS